VDETGLHGMVCCFHDYDKEVVWSADKNITVPSSEALFGGRINTSLIIIKTNATFENPNAAYLCFDAAYNKDLAYYQDVNIADWYLPSLNEMKTLGKSAPVINPVLSKVGGDILSGIYWTSSFNGLAGPSGYLAKAFIVDISDPDHLGSDESDVKHKVRAIRYF